MPVAALIGLKNHGVKPMDFKMIRPAYFAKGKRTEARKGSWQKNLRRLNQAHVNQALNGGWIGPHRGCSNAAMSGDASYWQVNCWHRRE
jgi:hypothetical protein